MKVLFCFASLIAVFSLVLTGSASAADNWWGNTSTDGLWSTSANWSLSHPCLITEKAKLNITPGPLITDGMSATANWIACGDGGDGAFRMTGGTLTVGTAPGDTWTILGYNGTSNGTFTMDGGTVNTIDRMFVGFMAAGTLNMNGGTLNIGGTFGIAHASAAAVGNVYLNGGTINCADFLMAAAGGTAEMYISGGVLIINGNKESLINGYISTGKIIFTGTEGFLSVIYDSVADKTIVGMSVDLNKARSPVPSNTVFNVIPDETLSWTAGLGAVSHKIYFGTANPPAQLLAEVPQTSFNPGRLQYNTTYYWRVDEINGPSTVTGDIWSFTTVSGLAKNPDPVSGSINVPLNKILHWTAGYGVTSNDIYFGTDAAAVDSASRPAGDLNGNARVDYNDLSIMMSYWLQDPSGSVPYAGVNEDNFVDFTDYAILLNSWLSAPNPLYKGTTADTAFEPNLAKGVTYYWRIDTVEGAQRRKGTVWSFTASSWDPNSTVIGKVMAGYQGWFNAPGDGTPRGWVHWGNGSFSYSSVNVDWFPDMTEYDPDEKFLAGGFYDGNDHYVFSSHNRKTVMRHFKWMQDYGIDGVYLQRFATECTPGSAPFNHRNDVLSYCKDGANTYGRYYAVMYDLSGLGQGECQRVIDDWKFLVDTMKVGRDPNDRGCMRHKGQPVVSVWGLGFGRAYEGQESYNLINFLKNDPVYGGNVVMLGVNDPWRTTNDTWFQQTLLLGDIISPWLVGRFGDTGGVNNWAVTKGLPDREWCTQHGKDFLPVLFPGFSWWNLQGHDPQNNPLNKIPRLGGQFLWDQVNANITIVGASMFYIAMFDEVDEGTAIFKVTNNPPAYDPTTQTKFMRLDIDGTNYPSDEYLWLTGEAGKALRGESTLTLTRPVRQP